MSILTTRICDGCGLKLPRADGFDGIRLSGQIDGQELPVAVRLELDGCSGTHLLVAVARRLDYTGALLESLIGRADPPIESRHDRPT